MTIGAATVFVALAIAPGLVLIVMALSAMRIQRDLGNTTLTLVFGAVAALVVHVGAALVLWLLWRAAGPDSLVGAVRGSLAVLVTGGQVGPADLLHAMLYASLAVGVGAGLGTAFGRAVVTRRIETDLFHGAYYRYFGRGEGIIFASVLTRAEMKGGLLIYEGLLRDLRLRPDGTVAGLALVAPLRASMTIGPNGDPAPGAWSDIGAETNDPENTLFIEGSEIANLVISVAPIDLD